MTGTSICRPGIQIITIQDHASISSPRTYVLSWTYGVGSHSTPETKVRIGTRRKASSNSRDGKVFSHRGRGVERICAGQALGAYSLDPVAESTRENGSQSHAGNSSDWFFDEKTERGPLNPKISIRRRLTPAREGRLLWLRLRQTEAGSQLEAGRGNASIW